MALHTKKVRSTRYPEENITDVDYADDIVLLANAPTQAESLLHGLKEAAGGISLYMIVEKQSTCVLHLKRGFSEISGQVRVPRQQLLI